MSAQALASRYLNLALALVASCHAI